MHHRIVAKIGQELIPVVAFLVAVLLAEHRLDASADVFPPSDVRVLSDGSTSGPLRIRFENLGNEEPTVRHRTVQYMLAGAAGRTPKVEVNGAHYYRYLGDRLLGQTSAIPHAPNGPEAITIAPLGRYRDYHVYRVQLGTVLSVTQNVGIPELWHLDWLDVTFDLGGVPTEGGTGASNPPSQAEFAHLLNPQILSGYRDMQPDRDWRDSEEWASAVNRALDRGAEVRKFRAYKPGLYALLPDSLELSSSASDVGKWRVFHRGREVPLLRDDRISTGGCVLFVDAFDEAVTGAEVFWFFSDAETSNTPLRMRLGEPETLPTDQMCSPTIAAFESVSQEFGDYHPKLKPSPEVTRWYWKAVGNGQTVPFDVRLPKHYDARDVELVVHFGYPSPISLPPTLELLANDRTIGVTTATIGQPSLLFRFAGGQLQPGWNKLGLRLRYPPRNAVVQDMLVQKIVVRWRQALDRVPESECLAEYPNGIRFVPDGQQQPSLGICLASTKNSPLRIIAIGKASGEAVATLVSGGSNRMVRFAEDTTGAMTLADARLLLAPPDVTKVRRFTLLEDRYFGDYIAIAHFSLLDALTPLLERRARQGHAVLAVDVETVFDHFSYGFRDPAAIKAYLSRVFFRSSGGRLRNVLLVGEASDYRGNPMLLPPRAHRDMVPVNGNPRGESPRGDHPYTTIVGTDALSDIALGRISVNTADSLTSVVEKLMRYEDAAPGEWMVGAEFVVDDNEEFPKVAAEVLSEALAPNAVPRVFAQDRFPYVPNMRVPGRRRSHLATKSLLADFERGVAVMNFFGHGGPNLWTHERLLHLMDLERINNTPRLPFITCASCDTAWLDYPLLPVSSSMGELLVNRGAGGGIGVFAPVAGASPYEHLVLVKRLMEAIYRKGLRETGAVTELGKNLYVMDSGSAGIPDQYVLLGDPASRLRVPELRKGLEVSPEDVRIGCDEFVKVTLPSTLDSPSSAVLNLVKYGGISEVTTHTMVRKDGEYLGRLPVGLLSSGSYGLGVQLSVGQENAVYVGRLNVHAPGIVLRSALQCNRGDETGQETTGILRVSNLGAVGEDRLRLVVQNPDGGNELLRCVMDIAKGGAVRELTVPFPSGIDEILFEISRERTPSTTLATCSLVRTRCPTMGAGVRICSEPLMSSLPWLSSLDQAELVTEVSNEGTTTANVLAALLIDGVHNGEDVTIGNLAVGEKRPVKMRTKRPLPPGEVRATLTIRDAATSITLHEQTTRVPVLRPAEISFVPGSAHVEFPVGVPVARSTIVVHAKLRNLGQIAARLVPIHLLVGDPKKGTEGKSLNDLPVEIIPSIAPGQTIDVRYRWEDSSSAGEQRLWLVAERDKPSAVSGGAKRTIAVPPFTLNRIGNFTVPAFSVHPDAFATTQTARFDFTVASDGPTTVGPVDIEYGFRNDLTQEISSRHCSMPSMPAESSVSLSQEAPVSMASSVAFVTANSDRELEELDLGDNSVERQILRSFPLSESVSGDGDVDFHAIMPNAFARNVELLPGGSLRLSDTFTSSAGLIPLEQRYVVSGSTVAGGGEMMNTDGRWRLVPWLLEAQSTEDVAEIVMRIPGGTSEPGVPHDVWLLPARSSSGTAAAGETRLGRRGEFRRIPTTSDRLGPDGQVYLGRTVLNDGLLELGVRQTSGSAVRLSAVEIIPAFGLVETPAFDLRTVLTSDVLRFRFHHENGDVEYFARMGDSFRELESAGWQPMKNGEEVRQSAGHLFQWRAFLLPNNDCRPTIRRVWLATH